MEEDVSTKRVFNGQGSTCLVRHTEWRSKTMAQRIHHEQSTCRM